MEKNILTLLTLMSFTTLANAACYTTSCLDEIDGIITSGSGEILVSTKGDESTLNCAAVGNEFLTVTGDPEGKKNIYATILTAKAQNRQMTIHIVPGSVGCQISYITLY